MLKLSCTHFSLILFLGLLTLAARAATITETRQTIKTYPFSDPDPLPILTRGGFDEEATSIYPYCAFDGFNKTAVDREWTVVRMENPYIEVFVLPEVGGKVWGAREKSTGREFIYMNHVLKFRQIALRGPWTSGGLEFNFGVLGHTPSAATPVDYLTRKNPDGSVSCVVGALDLPSRTRWSVTITLPPDKAWFATEPFWYNPTGLHQSYYAWMNAAVHVGQDMQYAFPGTAWIGHSYSERPAPWPRDSVRDLSWYKNNNFGSYKSYFTIGQYLDFFGVYWHGARLGMGHWARPDDAPGRKVWIWGLSREGMIWEDLLSDADGQYSEPQAGRYLDQSDTVFFQPGAADRWRELWFPYKDAGPIAAAAPCGVLGVTTSTQAVTLSFCALEPVSEELQIWSKEALLGHETLRLKPLEVWRKDFAVDGRGILRVTLGDKLTWTNAPAAVNLTRPIHFREYEGTTAESLYMQAERLEKGRKFAPALEKYQACLAQEPQHVRALGRVAELYLRRAEYEKAQEYAHRALDLDMYDPQANFIYGLIARQRGDLTGAREALGWAARSLEYRAAANAQMAEIFLIEKNYPETLEYARRALDFNQSEMNARQAGAIAARKQGREAEARNAIAEILALEPLNHFARAEAWISKPTPESLQAFQGAIRGELPHETYLELAAYYTRLNLTADALQVLHQAPQTPEVLYWLAWLQREAAPAETAALLQRAQAASPRLVFPFRPESIAVFDWAARQPSADWKANYYLGLIHWGLGRVDEARALFAQCGAPDFAPFHLIQARLNERPAPEKALLFYLKAVQIDRGEWRAWHGVVNSLSTLERTSESLQMAREAAARFPENDAVRLDLVKALMAGGDEAAALEILNTAVFLPFEGASEVHIIYVACQMKLAREKIASGQYEEALRHIQGARQWPERLGSGRPYKPDEREQDELQKFCYEKMKDKGPQGRQGS